MPDNPYPQWMQVRCPYCAAGRLSAGKLGHWVGMEIRECAAPTPDEYIAEIEKRVSEMGQQMEFDRTAIADCMTKALKAVDGRHWLTEGRGPYEWDDENWHKEFYAAAIEIREALAPLAKIAANWKDCPRTNTEIAQARIDLKGRIAELERELGEARNEIERLQGCLTDANAALMDADNCEILLAAARKDTARLEFLIDNECYVFAGNEWYIASQDDGKYQDIRGKSPRAVIDAAMGGGK